MARLTNRQMDVLAERVTDVLEQEHTKNTEKLRNSEEYTKFTETYKDDIVNALTDLLEKAKEAERLKDVLEEETNKIRDKVGNFYYNSYRPESSLKDGINSYLEKKRKEKYPEAEFNRDKVLRRVQADILLSDVTNPEELVNSLVEKLKQ